MLILTLLIVATVAVGLHVRRRMARALARREALLAAVRQRKLRQWREWNGLSREEQYQRLATLARRAVQPC